MLPLLTQLAGDFSLDTPNLHIPILGNRWTVGAFFLLHIILGSWTMGALVLAPTFELVGVARHDLRFERLARALATVLVRVFSLGATLGGFAVLVVTGLYPRFFVSLITIFFWPAVVAFSVWFLVLALLLPYALRWDRFANRKGLHIAMGYGAAAFEHVFLVIIVALDSFLLTPGKGIGAFFNASYFPELAHRFVGNVSWASFFIAAVAAVYAAVSRSPEQRWYHHWAARVSLVVGLTTLALQVVIGFIFVEAVKTASYGAFQYSLQGPVAWLWLLQSTLLAILLVGSNLYFWQSRPSPGPASPLLTGLVMVASLMTMAPAPLYPHGLFWVRYIALGVAVVLSLVHWLLWRPGRQRLLMEDLRRSGQVVLAVTGVAALSLFLLMGVIRTTARSDYTVYGVLKESDSYGIFQAPTKGYYP
jgi:cytochrome bd-type quinol oxidase subunit 1